MAEIVVITGAGAGIGRATVREFARLGCDVGLVGRNAERLEAAASEARRMGVRAVVAIADVADADAVEQAADRIETELGPITVWVNNAMATVFAPVADLTAEEVKRATEVTYLGTVHGMMAALRRMRRRGRGSIVNVGSALAYRSVPLQAAYCGAKSAIRGFTDSLRSEIIHDGDDIRLTMVHLPAVNTPQFDWVLNKTGYQMRPFGTVFEPEIPAAAIAHAAFHYRREWWIGFPTVTAILGTRIAAGFADRKLAVSGYLGQLSKSHANEDAPNNLHETVPGDRVQAHGRFDAEARTHSREMFPARHRAALAAACGGALLGVAVLQRLAANRPRTVD